MADGTDLRIAHLGWENGQITIFSLEMVSLPARLAKIKAPSAAQTVPIDAEGGDVFGLDDSDDHSAEFDSKEDEDDSEDPTGALINIFSKYPLKTANVAVNIPQGQAIYHFFETDFGLKGKKLEKKLREEIGSQAGLNLDSALLNYFPTEAGKLFTVHTEGTISLIDRLMEVKNFLAGGSPYFCQANAIEISLINLVRASQDLEPGRITAIVYIGAEFSRVLVLKGRDPLAIVQTIREGYASPHVCQTIFSKTLLEQEEAGIPEFDTIVLAGEVARTHAFDFFRRQFPDAEVKPITPGSLDTSQLRNEEVAIFPSFAIPVAMSWEALDLKNPDFLRTRLLPNSVKDAQKSFVIAWHGFLLLGMIFACMAILSYQGIQRFNKIKDLQESIQQNRWAIESLQQDLLNIHQLREKINVNRSNLTFLNSLIVDPDKWSRLFSKLSGDFKRVNKIWIERIQSTPEGFLLVGKSLTRDRIPKLAEGLDGVNLQRVTRIISEEGEIAYEFELTAMIPPSKEMEDLSSEYNSNHPIAQSEQEIDSASSYSMKDFNGVPENSPDLEFLDNPAGYAQEKANGLGEVTHRMDLPDPWKESAIYYERGVALIKERKVEEALVEFEKLLQKYPQAEEAPEAYYWMGECLYSSGDYEKSLLAFTTSLSYSVNSKKQACLAMTGMCYLKLDKKSEAARQFQLLLEAYPEGEYAGTAKRKLKELSG